MRRLVCCWFGHENIWTLDPLHPGEFIVICLRCRNRAFSYRPLPPASDQGADDE